MNPNVLKIIRLTVFMISSLLITLPKYRAVRVKRQKLNILNMQQQDDGEYIHVATTEKPDFLLIILYYGMCIRLQLYSFLFESLE